MEVKRKSNDFYNNVTGVSVALLPFIKFPNFKHYVGYALLLAGLDTFGDWKRWHEARSSQWIVFCNKQCIEKQSWIEFPCKTHRKSPADLEIGTSRLRDSCKTSLEPSHPRLTTNSAFTSRILCRESFCAGAV